MKGCLIPSLTSHQVRSLVLVIGPIEQSLNHRETIERRFNDRTIETIVYLMLESWRKEEMNAPSQTGPPGSDKRPIN